MLGNIFKKEKEAMKAAEKKAREANRIEDLKDEFFNLLFMAGYAKDSKRISMINKAKKIAGRLPELKGWPDDMEKFWDVEAYGWDLRIGKDIREKIRKELRKRLKGKKKNIELGAGTYPYLSGSVIADISKNMLDNAPKGHKKVLCNLDKKLPFKTSSFDSACLVFVADYLHDLKKTLKEIKRILKKNSRLEIVQSKNQISSYYHRHEKRFWKAAELKKLLESEGFEVKVDEQKIVNSRIVFIEAKCL